MRLAVITFALSLATTAMADIAPMRLVGGTSIRPMKPTSTRVAMDHEIIRLRLSPGRYEVNVVFRMKNHGKEPETITVGFPSHYKGVGPDDISQDELVQSRIVWQLAIELASNGQLIPPDGQAKVCKNSASQVLAPLIKSLAERVESQLKYARKDSESAKRYAEQICELKEWTATQNPPDSK